MEARNTQPAAPTLADEIRSAMKEAGGRADAWEKAEEIMMGRLKDKAFRLRFLDELLKIAIGYIVRRQTSNNRREHWRRNVRAQVTCDSTEDGLSLLAEANAEDIYKYELIGGVYLGGASVEDLKKLIAHHEIHASRNRERAIFLISIVSAMDKSRPVCESMTRESLEKLLREAKDAA